MWCNALIFIPEVPQPKLLNYFCPISVTALPSRIAEKLVVTRWLRPVFPSEAICGQFAFKSTGSSMCATVHIVRITLRVFLKPIFMFDVWVSLSLKPLTPFVMKYSQLNLMHCNVHGLFLT
jgi:hypothetical protein